MLYHEIEEFIKPTIKQVERKLYEYLYEKGFHVKVGFEFTYTPHYHESDEVWKIVLVPKNLRTDYTFEVVSMPWLYDKIDFQKLGDVLLLMIETGEQKYVEDLGAKYLIIEYKGEKVGWESAGE